MQERNFNYLPWYVMDWGGVVMGLAISGMHYTAMAGTHFPLGSVCLGDSSHIDPALQTLFVSTSLFFLLGAGILANLFEQRVARQKDHGLLLQMLQRDMEERARTMAMNMTEELRSRQHALSAISQGVLITDAQRHVTYVNDAFEQITGYAKAELMGGNWGAILQGTGTNPATVAELRATLNAGLPFQGEILNYRKDGTPFWNELSITPVRDSEGCQTQFVSVQRDITERKQTEQRERIRNQVLEQLAKGTPLSDILDALVRSVEASYFATLCAILLLDEEGCHLMHGAAPSLPDEYNRAIHGIAIGPCAGSCGTAAFRRERVIVSDIGSDPLWADHRELTLFYGLQACWSQPILSITGQVLGTFAMYYKEIHTPNGPELDAISDAANIASIAIEHVRTQQMLHIAATTFETQEGIIITDSNKAILRINRAFTRIYGYSIEDVIGTTPSILQSGRSEDEFYKTMWETLQRDNYWVGEIWDKRKNGEVFPAWLTITAVTEGGSITHYIGTFSDITDNKHTQEELQKHRDHLQELVEEQTANLRDSTARIHAILDTVADGIITIDEHGIVETFNPAAECLFDYTAAEVAGRNINMLMPEPYHSQHNGYLEHYHITGEAHVIGSRREVMGRRKDGSAFLLELAVSKIQLGEGCFYIGIVRDITERKQSEQALVVAKTEAEQASRAKSDFLATMSHEIRTPMNGVIGMVDVLHQTSLNGDQVEMVDTIRESAFSLLGIIEDILDFSKIEAGKLEIEHAPTAVAKVVEKICVMLDHLAEKKGVELTLFTDPAIPATVLGDAQRLRQIVINLASNAIKFSSGQGHPGRVSMQAVLVEHTAHQVVVEIRVTDNGIGIDQETQARLFTPFTQAEASTTRRFGGTGLGLTIAHNLVQLMGGEITVQSAPDQGSTFTVRLPFVPAPDKADDSATQSLVAGLSCLVVGGKESLADHLAIYLESAGAVVEQVPNLAAAREQAVAPLSGPWVWLIDAGNTPPLPEELHTITRFQPEQDVRLIVIGRGKRRWPRKTGDDQMVVVDGNVLTRQNVFQAVAIAAGRAQEEIGTSQHGKGEAAFIAPSRADALRQGRLILVAEDNPTNQNVILQQLALLGFAADVTSDGREALERWRSGDYALLLTDLHMPKMDGYELAAAIRAEETSARHIVIIAWTANAITGEELHCLDVGMDDYLSKPTPLANLKAMLKKWLSNTESTSQQADADSLSKVSITSTTQGATSKPLDVSVLAALVGDNPEVINEFLQDFRSSATQIAAEIQTAYAAGQTVQVGALAHKLKSSALAVGALELGELCAVIEQAGKAGQIEVLASLLSHFKVKMTAVNNYLDTL
jgi:PAS domain S-box-containing protein